MYMSSYFRKISKIKSRIYKKYQSSFFFVFFLVWAPRTPQAAIMPWGYLSRKKVSIFLKFKIIKTQIFDVETEGICVMVHNKHY